MKCPICSANLNLENPIEVARHFLTAHQEESLSLIADLGADFEITETYVPPPPPEAKPDGA